MAAKKNNTLKYVLIGAAVLIVLAIVANKMGWIGKGNVIQVSTDKSTEKNIIETVSASGKIQPEIEVKLSSEVSGEITELHVKEGDIVKKGQLLCRVRPDILQSGYDQARASYNTQKATLANSQQQLAQVEATFKNIQAKYNRNKKLFDDKVISAAEFDAARAEYDGAKANLEASRQSVIGSRFGLEQSAASVKQASDNLARTTIYSPSDGVVSSLSIELGERVVGTAQMAGTEIMRIADLSSMEVNVDVNENDINRLSLGDTAEIEVDAFLDKKFKGVVSEIASSAASNATAATTTTSTDQVTNFKVKIKILPASYAEVAKSSKLTSPFRPGLSATVDIQTEKTRALSVPIQSVTTRDDEVKAKPSQPKQENAEDAEEEQKKNLKEYVFVLNGTTVKQVQVKTGIQDDQNIQIISGLKAGDEVVSAPYTAISKTLKDKATIEKVDKSKLFEAEGDKKD